MNSLVSENVLVLPAREPVNMRWERGMLTLSVKLYLKEKERKTKINDTFFFYFSVKDTFRV